MDPRTTFDRRSEVQILDVRWPEEWAAGHIAEAVHIPMDQIPERLAELDRERPVVAVCRSGHRSGHVTEYLRHHGLTAENMRGGLEQWAAEGLPLTHPRSASR